ncbi:GroES-like protein [Penicillium angulare]|uniref:GroES-like protein n=1 Tax=Penicillium angulare TaxID=116970 RepID=UPI002541C73B|nr:GroES-like protein [Penicillium angulare]KAJ5281705.1 GroES-like protein [Penicillium angulare]
MAETQVALLVTKLGEPLSKVSRSIPAPKEGEVLVKVTVAGLNPHDAKSRDHGLFIKDHLPAILGADVVGVVTSLGPNVTRFKEGDHVFGQAGLLGPNLGGYFNFGAPNFDTQGLQEYAILDIKYSAKVPSGFTDAQMATVPTNCVPAAVALFDKSCFGIPAPWDPVAAEFDYKGTSLLILGGGSNTGKFGIQLAALVGIGKIIVVAGLKGAADAQALGATHVIDRTLSATDIAAEVQEIVGDNLIYAFDTINEPGNQYVGVEALSNTKTGKLARLIPLGPVDVSKLSSQKPAGFDTLDVLGVSTGSPITTIPLWENIVGWIEEEKLKPTSFQVIKGLDLDIVNKTLDGYSNGTVTGQWQVHF